MKALNMYGVILVAMALSSWFFNWLQLTCSGYIGHRILLKLRTDLFDHLQKLSLGFYSRHEVGRVMSRVKSVTSPAGVKRYTPQKSSSRRGSSKFFGSP